MTTPAGYYPDPEGSMRYRYWDGRRWTDEYGGPVKKTLGTGTVIAGALAAVFIGCLLFMGLASACDRIADDYETSSISP